MSDRVFALFLVFLVLMGGLIVAGFFRTTIRLDDFNKHCEEAGGHIYNPGGIRYCVKDGLWVEVYP